jgi:hypothetical protein
VDEVVRASLEPALERVSNDDLDVSQTLFADVGSGYRGETRLALHTHDDPCRTDPLGQEIEDSDRPATEVDRSRARQDTDLIEQPSGMRFDVLCLGYQSLLLRKRDSQRIGDG